jgi:hypothetical protein
MGVELTRAAHVALPGSDLDKTARFALVLLADAAKDTTGLCWPSQATLASIIGCAPNYLTIAMRALATAGMVSTWRRPGRVPLHLIHPTGIVAHAPSTSAAIRKHLRQGTFTTVDITAALDWLRTLGAVMDTPKAILGVGRCTPKMILPHPQGDLGPTPKITLAEPLLNPKETRSAGSRPAIVGGLAGPAAETVGPAGAAASWATRAELDAIKAAAVAAVDGRAA